MITIPKIIHYCWLSNDPKPQAILDCIESWKKHMPDYELMHWDMNRFDVNSVPFVKDACAARKWATATDYIRLYALYHHGGVYMDLDVEVYKSFDPFLHHSAFSSVEFWPQQFFESIKQGSTSGLGIEAAVLGSIPHHPWIKACMDIYDTIKFEHTDQFMNFIIMSGQMAKVSAKDFGFKYEPVYQVLKDDVHIYPPDVFSKRSADSVIKYATHLCANSWRDPIVVKQSAWKYILKEKILGEKLWHKLRTIIMRQK